MADWPISQQAATQPRVELDTTSSLANPFSYRCRPPTLSVQLLHCIIKCAPLQNALSEALNPTLQNVQRDVKHLSAALGLTVHTWGCRPACDRISDPSRCAR